MPQASAIRRPPDHGSDFAREIASSSPQTAERPSATTPAIRIRLRGEVIAAIPTATRSSQAARVATFQGSSSATVGTAPTVRSTPMASRWKRGGVEYS